MVDFELIKSIRTKNTFRDLFEMHDDIKKIDSIINVNKIFLQSFIKEEPEDISSDVDEMDPSQFLAQENDDEMDDEHPPILTSLGLTHVSHVSI